MSRYPILLITGVSRTGKTKLKEELDNCLNRSRFFLCEVDDNNPPYFNSLEEALDWTHKRVNGFFKEASEKVKEDPPRMSGITGIIYPERVSDFASDFLNLEPIYCLLEIDDGTLRERLEVKFEKDPSKVSPFFNINKEQVESLRQQVEATPNHLILDGTKPVRQLAQEVKEVLIDANLPEIAINPNRN